MTTSVTVTEALIRSCASVQLRAIRLRISGDLRCSCRKGRLDRIRSRSWFMSPSPGRTLGETHDSVWWSMTGIWSSGIPSISRSRTFLCILKTFCLRASAFSRDTVAKNRDAGETFLIKSRKTEKDV
ncbi:hypothetical protein E2C01_010694 [Portunus trituberculatus]|uniref:Uncharacterized protein n=1 Tax=Portunus trituberculatus TaxID=210409 RepID=A0A5B7D9C7_PORTR|nr:hypothetical protein [Portunus trituberculatus]